VEIEELKQELEALHAASFAWTLTCCGFDRSLAEDVLQTTYLKILDGRAVFKGRSSLKTWLFAVIRNTAAQQRRARLLRRLLPLPSTTQSPAQQAEDSERRAQVRRALNALARRQREVLDLVFFHELTVEQAAQVMGVRVGSARVHYHRAKRALRQRLEDSR